MSRKKSRLTGRVSRDLPLPAEHNVQGGDGKPPVSTGMAANLQNMRHEVLKAVAQNLRA